MSEATEAQTPAAMAVLTAAGLHAEAVYDDDLEATAVLGRRLVADVPASVGGEAGLR